FHVTGVQTCALPISAPEAGDAAANKYLKASGAFSAISSDQVTFDNTTANLDGSPSDVEAAIEALAEYTPRPYTVKTDVETMAVRSEERRVGKERRCR